jgi:hypothetical protein
MASPTRKLTIDPHAQPIEPHAPPPSPVSGVSAETTDEYLSVKIFFRSWEKLALFCDTELYSSLKDRVQIVDTGNTLPRCLSIQIRREPEFLQAALSILLIQLPYLRSVIRLALASS